MPYFKVAIDKANTSEQKIYAEEDHRFATAAWIQFKTTANQIHFIIEREKYYLTVVSNKSELRKIVKNEIQLAKEMYSISKADSRIGFETSNHYYYLPLDFIEKTINCEYILQRFN